MPSTTHARVRALSVVGMAAVAAAVGTVTYQASAAEVTAPAAVGADARAVAIPAIPDAIRPPANSQPIGASLVAAGTQNYTCVVPAGATTGAYTGSSTPEAHLIGTGGPVHHFAGPSWQSLRDGSLVTATKVSASDRAGTIPELLLKVATHAGSGIMDKADYINRLHTSGGVAPTGPCAKDAVAKVPYKAVYVFWDAPAAP
jgi:hypothetical protein